MANPFYLQEIPVDAPFCNRIDELRELQSYAEAKTLEKLLFSEKAVFEAIIQGLTSQQRLLLQALAKEPTQKILASSYISKHSIGSIGGIQHALRQLEELDLVEKAEQTGYWNLVDPLFAVWLKSQTEERIT